MFASVSCKRIDRAVQAAGARQGGGHLGRRPVEMLGQELLAQAGDRAPNPRIAACLDREIAFGVDAERSIGEVRRADHQELVVHDQHLAVHVEAAGAVIEPGQHRTVKPVAAVAVRRAQRAVVAAAQHAHRRDLEPAALRERRQDRDFRRIALAQPLGEGRGDRARREILILREDVALRAGDCVEVKMADLADGGVLVECRLGARDRNVDVGQRGFDPLRPRVGDGHARHPARLAACRAPPALPRELAQRSRTVAGNDNSNVVERGVRLAAVIDTMRIVVRMLARVPARPREVESADECDSVVDHDEFLMMRSARRMLVVEAKRQPPVRAPIQLVDRQPFALHRVEHREIPREHVAAQPSARRDDGVQEIVELLRKPVVRALRHETRPAVDVPADDEDGATRAGKRIANRPEIILAVDQERDALGALDPPATAARLQQRRAAWGSGTGPVTRQRQGRFEVHVGLFKQGAIRRLWALARWASVGLLRHRPPVTGWRAAAPHGRQAEPPGPDVS